MKSHPVSQAERWIGLTLIVLGLVTVSGWLFHRPALTQWFVGLLPMVFNTGLSFVATGVALVGWQAPGPRRVRLLIAVGLVILSSTTLLELALDHSLGVDFPGLHTWFDYGNIRPGRMAPNTALGFLLIGSTLLLTDRITRTSHALVTIALTFGVMAIGLTGLVGYLLAPDLLFGWARSARMAIHTAVGMLLAATGLWAYWSNSGWYTGGVFVREGTKIRVLSAAILFIVTVTAGLSGFVLLQHSLEHSIEAQLSTITTARGPWLQTFAAQVRANANGSVQVAGLPLRDSPVESTLDAGKLGRSAQKLMALGYRGVAFTDSGGTVLSRFGHFTDHPVVDAALQPSDASALVWDQGLVLRTRIDIARQAGNPIHAVEVDQAIPELGRLLFNPGGLGPSAEVVACIQQDARQLICVPNVSHPAPFLVGTRAAPAQPLPMQRALAGESGISYAVDYRARNVIAAYGTLAPGIGFVAKQDTTEAYAPIRSSLAVGAPIILAIALLGAIAMYSQLNPLLRRMNRSELVASQAVTHMQTVVDAVGDGILTIDERGDIRSANAAAHQIFGYAPGELLALNVSALMPAGMRSAHRAGMANMLAGGAPQVIGRRDVQLPALRLDGSEFPMELTVNAIPSSDGQLFVGVIRDITLRKQIEEKLSRMAEYDSLTGLPNRAFFLDRLSTALLRASRSKQAIALMFIDLDGFKAVNDTLGHAAGDELLKEVARRLTASVRAVDTVARLAGDEFTIVLEELKSPTADSDRLAAKLLQAMRAPFTISSNVLHISASVGLIVHDPEQDCAMDAAGLIRGADGAMYAAKRAGKNAVVRHSAAVAT